MGLYRQRIRERILATQEEIERTDQEARATKERLVEALKTLRAADAALTDDTERLLVALDGLNIRIGA